MLKYRGTGLIKAGFIGAVLIGMLILVGLSPDRIVGLATNVRYQAMFSEAGGLATGQPPHFGNEAHHLQRRRECPMGRGRDAVLVHRDAPNLGYFFRHLGGR